MSNDTRPRPAHHTGAVAIGRDDIKTFRLWLRRGAHEYPAFVWSAGILAVSWIAIFTIPPIRKNVFGYVPQTPIPNEYPAPPERKKGLSGYDDP